jgi:hypothetical protein
MAAPASTPRPLVFPFSPIDCDNANKWGVLATRGGISSVRSGTERDQTAPKDNLVGQLAAMAGCIWLTGNLDAYRLARAYALEQGGGTHATPVRGSNECFKSTRIHTPQALWKYTLSLAPWETRVGWNYTLVLVPREIRPFLIPGCPAFALFMGQAPLTAFPDVVDRAGTFKGKYTLRVSDLSPCQARHGLEPASDALIAALEDALDVKPQDRWV